MSLTPPTTLEQHSKGEVAVTVLAVCQSCGQMQLSHRIEVVCHLLRCGVCDLAEREHKHSQTIQQREPCGVLQDGSHCSSSWGADAAGHKHGQFMKHKAGNNYGLHAIGADSDWQVGCAGPLGGLLACTCCLCGCCPVLQGLLRRLQAYQDCGNTVATSQRHDSNVARLQQNCAAAVKAPARNLANLANLADCKIYVPCRGMWQQIVLDRQPICMIYKQAATYKQHCQLAEVWPC